MSMVYPYSKARLSIYPLFQIYTCISLLQAPSLAIYIHPTQSLLQHNPYNMNAATTPPATNPKPTSFTTTAFAALAFEAVAAAPVELADTAELNADWRLVVEVAMMDSPAAELVPDVTEEAEFEEAEEDEDAEEVTEAAAEEAEEEALENAFEVVKLRLETAAVLPVVAGSAA